MRLEQLEKYGVLDRTRPVPPPSVTADSIGIDAVLPGAVRWSQGGSCLMVSSTYPGDYRHGLHDLAAVTGLSPDRMAFLCRDSDLAYADLEHAVFLDTETTGLGMGAGTYVFLIGAGYMDQGGFRVDQFFLLGPQHEAALLTELSEFLSQFSAIVTFNGKAFDWPLLESRFHRHRRTAPVLAAAHIDLLHPARRLWKRRLESCALTSLERSLLSVERTEDDVPGYLIPHLYFRYQSAGDAAPLRGVFYHNAQDILSLAALAIHVDSIVGNPEGGWISDGLDYLSLGRMFDKAGDASGAGLCYEEALTRDLTEAHRCDCLLFLSALHKRERQWEAAVNTWHQLVDQNGPASLAARVELAKYYEHVEREYLTAIDHVENALLLLDLHPEASTADDRRELERRLGRLLNRALRHRSWVSR